MYKLDPNPLYRLCTDESHYWPSIINFNLMAKVIIRKQPGVAEAFPSD